MTRDWVFYVPWVYISLQVLILMIISVIGVEYVRTEFLSHKSKQVPQELQININKSGTNDKEIESEQEQKETTDISKRKKSENGTRSTHKSFCKSWLKIVWKMRSVYCAFAAHVFGVLTLSTQYRDPTMWYSNELQYLREQFETQLLSLYNYDCAFVQKYPLFI